MMNGKTAPPRQDGIGRAREPTPRCTDRRPRSARRRFGPRPTAGTGSRPRRRASSVARVRQAGGATAAWFARDAGGAGPPQTPPVGPTVPGRRGHARRIAPLDRGSSPRIASGPGHDGVERGRAPGRVAQRRRGTGPGERGACRRSARWPAARQPWAREPGGGRRGGTGPGYPLLAGAAAAGDRPAGGAACGPRAGQARPEVRGLTRVQGPALPGRVGHAG